MRPPTRQRQKIRMKFQKLIKIGLSPRSYSHACLPSSARRPVTSSILERECWNYSCNTAQHRQALLKKEDVKKFHFPRKSCTLTRDDASMQVENKYRSTHSRCQNDMTNTQLTLRMLCSCGIPAHSESSIQILSTYRPMAQK